MGFKFTATTLALIIFSFLVLAPGYGDAGDTFFDWNVTEEDVRIIPEATTTTLNDIDLSDTYDRSNISIVESGNITSAEDSQAVTLENSASSGYVIYSTPNLQYLETRVNQTGFLESSGINVVLLDGSLQSVSTFNDVSGTTTGKPQASADYVQIEFTKQDYYLFDLVWAESEPTSGISRLIEILLGIGTFPLTLWNMFTYFPIYVQLFYGGMLTYMIVDIVQVG